jgi:hypothetical protein
MSSGNRLTVTGCNCVATRVVIKKTNVFRHVLVTTMYSWCKRIRGPAFDWLEVEQAIAEM